MNLIYTLPFIAAIIGWFTNYLAVKMLFRPRRKRKFLFLEFHGVFPKRQAKLAEKIGKMVADELLSSADIKEKIGNPETIEGLKGNIEIKIDEFLQETFPKKYPVMSLLVGKKAKSSIKEDLLDEIERVAPDIIEKYMQSFEESFDVEETIRQRVAILSPVKLENLINSILKKEFKFIELVGAMIGFVIGVIQVALVHL